MTPARATGPSASQMSRVSGSSSRSAPSRVVNRVSPRLGQAHHDLAAPETLKIEGVEGLAELQQDVVGDIHQVIDGP